jgi:tetratricopeptide (TPR) repeat protein
MFSRRIVFLSLMLVGVTTYAQENPKKPYILYELAESAHRDGELNEALSLLNECLKVNPGYMEAYSLRGTVREQLKDLDGAHTDFSIFLDKHPDHLEVLLSRAVLRYNIGFYALAIEDFQRLLLLPPTGETTALFYKKGMSVNDKNPVMTTTQGSHHSYLLNYLGLAEAKLKNYSQAKIYFDSAIRMDPREPDYFVNRGLAKESLNDSTALLDYERAILLNPDHVLAQHNLKALKAKKIKSTSIEERLTETIAADSTMLYPYLERAQQRYEAKYYQGALDDYTMALEIDTSNVEIWLARGLTREKLKDYKGAFSDYTKAIDLKADYAKGWLNRGNVLTKLERYGDAVEDYNVALIYYPDYALAFYNRAMAKMKLKKEGEACTDLKQAEALGMKVETKIKNKVCEN